jgi:hypothetical protein
MKRAWELLALLIIFGIVVQLVISFIAPLIPYIAIGALVLLAGYIFVARRRSW